MSKWPKPIFAFLGTLVSAGLVFAFAHNPEPRYRNIPLSEWLALQRSYDFREVSRVMVIDGLSENLHRERLGPYASEAIKQIGTNALPLMLAWMKAPRTSWRIKVATAFQKLPRPIRPDTLPAWLDYSRDLQRVSMAYGGFRVLGAAAAPAAPELARIACDPRTSGSDTAISVLVQIGRPAVPELIGLLATNVAPGTRANAIIGLGNMGPNAAESVPAITACLKQSDVTMACLAARTLACIRRRSEIAIPALIESLNDPRFRVRLAAARALGDYGSEALPATAALRDLCVQPDIDLAREAERALIKIGVTALSGMSEAEFKTTVELLGLP